MFPKSVVLRILLVMLAIAVSGGIIAQVSNQIKQVDFWSPSGLKPKPDNLPKKNPNQIQREIFTNPADIPDEIVYGQIFRHLEELNIKADDEQRNNRDGSKFRGLYKVVAQLEEKEARTLDRIANQTNARLKQVDNRIRQIIDEAHAKTPGGRIPKGQPMPTPPPELDQLSEQRKNIILQGMMELRQNFGEAEFAKFTEFVNKKVKTGIKKIDPKQ